MIVEKSWEHETLSMFGLWVVAAQTSMIHITIIVIVVGLGECTILASSPRVQRYCTLLHVLLRMNENLHDGDNYAVLHDAQRNKMWQNLKFLAGRSMKSENNHSRWNNIVFEGQITERFIRPSVLGLGNQWRRRSPG